MRSWSYGGGEDVEGALACAEGGGEEVENFVEWKGR